MVFLNQNKRHLEQYCHSLVMPVVEIALSVINEGEHQVAT